MSQVMPALLPHFPLVLVLIAVGVGATEVLVLLVPVKVKFCEYIVLEASLHVKPGLCLLVALTLTVDEVVRTLVVELDVDELDLEVLEDVEELDLEAPAADDVLELEELVEEDEDEEEEEAPAELLVVTVFA